MKYIERKEYQQKFFEVEISTVIDNNHELIKLSEKIDWEGLDKKLGKYYSEKEASRPSISIRKIVSILMLQYIYQLSDKDVLKRWKENLYWQKFSGNVYYEKEVPFDRTSLVKFRKRIGEEVIKIIFEESVKVAERENVLKKKDYEEILVDTTVQEKNIRYPTDASLRCKGIEKVIKVMRRNKIEYRQSYEQSSKKKLLEHNRNRRAKKYKAARMALRWLHTRLGRVLREFERKSKDKEIKENDRKIIELCRRVYNKEKVYSLHEAEVSCIAKGKANKKYEFGCKVSISRTVKSKFIVDCQAFLNNPYDGHTLNKVLDDIEKSSNVDLKKVKVSTDLGYRGHGCKKKVKEVLNPKRKKLDKGLKRLVRARAGVEATISHLKRCFKLGKNYLKSTIGDKMNCLLASAAYNFSRLMRRLATT